MSKAMNGKYVVCRARLAGVHAGKLIEFNPADNTCLLEDAHRLWRFYTRDKSGSLSDIAANGLRPDKPHQIGAKIKTVLIHEPEGFEFDEMTEEAYKSVTEWKNN